MSWIPAGFLEAIPKSDLHVHLDGSLRLSTLIELAQGAGVALPAYTEAGMREHVFKETYRDLPEYLKGFKYTVAVMRTRANLERVAYEFAQDNFSEGVRYFEVRFAPQLLASIDKSDSFNIREVIGAVNVGLRRARDEANATLDPSGKMPFYDYGIIVCAMRMFPPTAYFNALTAIHAEMDHSRLFSLASETLIATAVKCRDEDGVPVVALDIAGAENGYPNKVHSPAFAAAHEHFFNKTVHAGEGYGPESIFQAVIDLHAERIGHGYHLFSAELIGHAPGVPGAGAVDDSGSPSKSSQQASEYVRKLVKYVCDRRICLEVCLTSNCGTMPHLNGRLENHACRKMIAAGVSVSLCTDNRLVSDTNTVLELSKAISAFDLTPKQIREIVLTGFKRSFFHGDYAIKRKYMRSVMDFYDDLAAKYGVAESYEKHISANPQHRPVASSPLPWPPTSPGGSSERDDSR